MAITPDVPAFAHLTEADIENLAVELDAIRLDIEDSRGERDSRYIRRTIAAQRALEVAGRLMLAAGSRRSAWWGGTVTLGVAKILENMEIGHNVMHGQWDWMRDPEIHSTTWEWDNVCPSSQWKHTHNEMHHMWTNVLGKDRDIGYGLLRVTEEQKWSKGYLPQPIYASVLALLFQWGVGTHDCDIYHQKGDSPRSVRAREKMAEFKAKARKQVLKDYVLFPALAGPFFLPVLAGNLVANAIRNVWAFAIIFCGHFPDGAMHFTVEQVENGDAGSVVRPSDRGFGQHLRRPSARPDVGQPQLPDRAPRLPRHAVEPLRRDPAPRSCAVREARRAVHDGFVPGAVRQDVAGPWPELLAAGQIPARHRR